MPVMALCVVDRPPCKVELIVQHNGLAKAKPLSMHNKM